MELETALGITWMVAAPLLGLALGWFLMIRPIRRAEQNLRQLLKDAPGREELAELILQNPTSENIQKGRELVISVLDSLSRKDRKEIASGFYQDSIRGRAWYTAKLVTDGRSNNIRRMPSDERVAA